MYNDEANLAYLLFLLPILIKVQINKLFQSNNSNSTKLLRDLTLLINSIAKRLILPTCRLNPILNDLTDYFDPRPYLGYRFENKIAELEQKGKMIIEEKELLRERCRS